jgi:ribosome recycling factor
MNRKVEMLFSECQSQMNAHAMLLYIRYADFCVKAEPFSLLNVTVEVDDAEQQIEQVCGVDMPDDYTFVVYPNENQYVPAIIKGIAKEHPEFELEEKREKTTNASGQEDEEIELHYHMPKVDDNRFKAGTEYVDLCYDAAKTHIDAVQAKYSVKIPLAAKDEDTDALKERLKADYDKYIAQCDEFKATKLAELEEAHNAYLADMTNVQQKEAEQENSEGINKIYSLNLEEL